MGTIIDGVLDTMFDKNLKVKEHPDEVVKYNISLTPRQLYKLAIILDHVRVADEDGIACLLKYHPSNIDHDKLMFDNHSLGTTLYFDKVSDEEVERMWDEEEYGC